jgi:hypothetical protein
MVRQELFQIWDITLTNICDLPGTSRSVYYVWYATYSWNTAGHSNTLPGDSITQAGYDQSEGFALAAELQSGTVPSLMNES